jgi:hypothetical protein
VEEFFVRFAGFFPIIFVIAVVVYLCVILWRLSSKNKK